MKNIVKKIGMMLLTMVIVSFFAFLAFQIIPGIGRLLLTSIANRDFPVVQAIVVILALWVVLVNCLADILNQRLDPRLRLQ